MYNNKPDVTKFVQMLGKYFWLNLSRPSSFFTYHQV